MKQVEQLVTEFILMINRIVIILRFVIIVQKLNIETLECHDLRYRYETKR